MEQPGNLYSGTPWELPPERNPHYHKAQRKNLGRIGFAFLTYLLFTALFSTAALIALAAFFPAFHARYYELLAILLSVVPSYFLGVPLVAGLLMGMPKKVPEKKKLGLKGWITFLAISIFLMLVGNYIAVILMSAVEALLRSEITNLIDQQISQSSVLTNLILVVIIAPIAEELLCRKLVIDRLLPYSEVLAVVTSGILFGLLHGNFYQFFYATFLGFLFGIVYIKTGNILHTVTMHMIVNFIGSIISDFINKMTSDMISIPTSINPWDIVSAFYSAALFLLAICGGVLLFRSLRQNKLKKIGERYLTLPTQFRLAWVNAGMILYCGFCLIIFAGSLFI